LETKILIFAFEKLIANLTLFVALGSFDVNLPTYILRKCNNKEGDLHLGLLTKTPQHRINERVGT
jgi:hypothetical protein